MPTVRTASRGCPRACQGPSKAGVNLGWNGTEQGVCLGVSCGLCVHMAGKRLSKHVFVRLSQSVAKADFKLVIPLPQHLHINPETET